MNDAEVRERYFDWIYRLVFSEEYSDRLSYRRLLHHMSKVEFVPILLRDENRAADGIDLRRRFAHETGYCLEPSTCIPLPCSVLEMMVALSVRCEEAIMFNPVYGDRRGQWFWMMIVNLGLGSMDDAHFDVYACNDILKRFMLRKYEANGQGGLFILEHPPTDPRKVEIWMQLCWYLNEIGE